MAKPEQCGHCKKPATIHLTQIVQNKIQKVDLCEDCPFKKNVTDPKGFSLADFLTSQPQMASMGESSMACPSCGMQAVDFKRTGRLGCPDCYVTFGEMLRPMLSNMHKDVCHRGKIPEHAIHRVHRERKKETLRAEIEEAIQNEDYEKAAELRDAITAIESDLPEEDSQ